MDIIKHILNEIQQRAVSTHFESKEQANPLNSSEKCLQHTVAYDIIDTIANIIRHIKKEF